MIHGLFYWFDCSVVSSIHLVSLVVRVTYYKGGTMVVSQTDELKETGGGELCRYFAL